MLMISLNPNVDVYGNFQQGPAIVLLLYRIGFRKMKVSLFCLGAPPLSPQTPYLNPIEHFWEEVERQRRHLDS